MFSWFENVVETLMRLRDRPRLPSWKDVNSLQRIQGIAMKSLPVGAAYSVWVGVGPVGAVILGVVLLDEPANLARLLSILLIIAGIVGLKLATPA